MRIVTAIGDDMLLADRLEAMHTANVNADLSRRVMLWQEAGALLRSSNEASSRRRVRPCEIICGLRTRSKTKPFRISPD
jgi:hypothetical protein